MRFLIMTDIEGVTGVTTFPQAENSELGRSMLMHDLLAVIDGIKSCGKHEIVVYDMHTDGRNVDLTRLDAEIPVVMGKPISREVYRGVGAGCDGLFLLGLHAMQHEPGALLAHSYLREYDAIRVNGQLVGEIGVEALLAGEQGIPLVFVSGDDIGCREAERLITGVVTSAVKVSLDSAQALCYPPAKTYDILSSAARKAVLAAKDIKPMRPGGDISIEIDFSDCRYASVMRSLHPERFKSFSTFEIRGKGMLNTWGEYLLMEREMLQTANKA